MSKINCNEVVESKDLLSTDFETLVADEVSYELPTHNNLDEGIYASRIKDIEVIKADSKMTAVDCYHELEDSKGDVFYIRFRFFDERGGVKELVSVFRKYGFANFADAIGVEETVTVAHKANSSYLYISSRKKRKKCSPLTAAWLASKSKTAPSKVDVSDEDDLEEDDYLLDDED